MNLQLILAVAIGGAIGSVTRYLVGIGSGKLFGVGFPWGTLIINVTGSFVIGFFGTLTGPDGRVMVSGTTRQFVMVGLCGGYTTFSSFSLQTLNLVEDGEWLSAAGNIFGSVILCLLFVWLGAISAAALNQLKGNVA